MTKEFKNMNKYLQDIAEEKLGFSFGESWRYSEDSLVSLLPILRKTSKKKNYLLLSECEKAEVKDTGMINKIEVYNGEKQPIYIRMGEIFSGKSQERSAIRSYVIMPKEKVQVDVRCVYASKGINVDASMKSGGIVPDMMHASFANFSFRGRDIDQSKVWDNVQMCAASMSASASSSLKASDSSGDINFLAQSDDLMGTMDEFSKQIDHILEKVPHFDNQVGIATLDLKGVGGIEIYDMPGSWKAMRDAIIKKEGENLSKEEQDSPFEYKKAKAVKSVKNALLLDYEEKTVFKSKDYRIVALKKDDYVGEFVELGTEIIHLTIIRK